LTEFSTLPSACGDIYDLDFTNQFVCHLGEISFIPDSFQLACAGTSSLAIYSISGGASSSSEPQAKKKGGKKRKNSTRQNTANGTQSPPSAELLKTLDVPELPSVSEEDTLSYRCAK
jgi:hypothetical protein